MDAHYDRVSHNSYELCIMHLHYALGVHIVCYVLCIMCIMYYVLCIMYYVLSSNFEFRIGIPKENAISVGRSWVVPHDFRPRVVGYYPQSPTIFFVFACFPKET